MGEVNKDNYQVIDMEISDKEECVNESEKELIKEESQERKREKHETEKGVNTEKQDLKCKEKEKRDSENESESDEKERSSADGESEGSVSSGPYEGITYEEMKKKRFVTQLKEKVTVKELLDYVPTTFDLSLIENYFHDAIEEYRSWGSFIIHANVMLEKFIEVSKDMDIVRRKWILRMMELTMHGSKYLRMIGLDVHEQSTKRYLKKKIGRMLKNFDMTEIVKVWIFTWKAEPMELTLKDTIYKSIRGFTKFSKAEFALMLMEEESIFGKYVDSEIINVYGEDYAADDVLDKKTCAERIRAIKKKYMRKQIGKEKKEESEEESDDSERSENENAEKPIKAKDENVGSRTALRNQPVENRYSPWKESGAIEEVKTYVVEVKHQNFPHLSRCVTAVEREKSDTEMMYYMKLREAVNKGEYNLLHDAKTMYEGLDTLTEFIENACFDNKNDGFIKFGTRSVVSREDSHITPIMKSKLQMNSFVTRLFSQIDITKLFSEVVSHIIIKQVETKQHIMVPILGDVSAYIKPANDIIVTLSTSKKSHRKMFGVRTVVKCYDQNMKQIPFKMAQHVIESLKKRNIPYRESADNFSTMYEATKMYTSLQMLMEQRIFCVVVTDAANILMSKMINKDEGGMKQHKDEQKIKYQKINETYAELDKQLNDVEENARRYEKAVENRNKQKANKYDHLTKEEMSEKLMEKDKQISELIELVLEFEDKTKKLLDRIKELNEGILKNINVQILM